MLAAIQTVALAQVAATEDRACEDGTVVEEFRGLGHQRLDAPALVQDVLGLTARGCHRPGGHGGGPGHAAPPGARGDGCRAGSMATERGSWFRSWPRRRPTSVSRWSGGSGSDWARSQVGRCVDAPGACWRLSTPTWSGSRPSAPGRSGLCGVARSRSASTSGLPWCRWSSPDRRGRWSTGLARSYVVQGRCARIDQARADALMDLIHARATGQVGVQLTVPASAMALAVAGAGEAGDPEARRRFPVMRWCPSPASACRGSRTSAPHGWRPWRPWRRGSRRAARGVRVVACDDHTGALTSLPVPVPSTAPASALMGRAPVPDGNGAYRPPAWLVEFVKARDGHCRFPGCTVSARFCDIDHVVAWPTGPTHPSNLACLCRRHHRVKQRPRWRVEMQPGAVLVWTDPCGRVRTTMPPDQLQLDGAMVPGAPVQAKSAEVTQPTEATAPTAPEATAPKRGCMLPSVLEDEIALCLGRHHLLARARLRQRHQVHRQPSRRGIVVP